MRGMIGSIEIEKVKEIAVQAGAEILEIYGTEFSVETKGDESPLTEADRKANFVIVKALTESFPEIPIISEETKVVPYSERKDWKTFWLVDPLDGTKEFIKRNGEFTVNIALINERTPVAGVVYQPVGSKLFWAKSGEGAWKSVENGPPVRLEGGPRYSEKQKIVVVASRSHLTDEVQQFVDDLRCEGKEVEFFSSGSSLKLCLVAEGTADVYPRLGPTMEWDTGAAHAIALEAGRKVLAHPSGEPLHYNKEDFRNPWFVVE